MLQIKCQKIKKGNVKAKMNRLFIVRLYACEVFNVGNGMNVAFLKIKKPEINIDYLVFYFRLINCNYNKLALSIIQLFAVKTNEFVE